MTIEIKVKGGNAGKYLAGVTDERTLCVQDTALPSPEPEGRAVIYRQYLTTTGLASGSNDMQVDGSSTPVEFWVSADPTYDLYISTLSFVIVDASATLSKFGNITALTNGCDLEFFSNEGVVTIATALKSNFDFVRLCGGIPAFGDGAGAFRASNMLSTSEGYLPMLDVEDTFGIPFGLRLRAGSTDKITLRVNDLTTGVDQFDCIAYGFTRRSV